MLSQNTVQKLSYNDIVKQLLEKSKQGIAQLFLDEADILRILQDNARAQVLAFRMNAREIGALMRALADPDTEKEEPLERLRLRRIKMVEFAGALENFRLQLLEAATAATDEGGKVLVPAELIALGKRLDINIPKKVLPSWLTTQAQKTELQINQASQEIGAFDKDELQISEATYATYKESYDVAMQNLRQAELILERAEKRAPGLMKAVRAYTNAVKLRDQQRGLKAGGGDAVDNLINDWTADMENARGTLRADEKIDADLDAMRPVTIETQMAKFDASAGNASVLDEIKKAAAAQK